MVARAAFVAVALAVAGLVLPSEERVVTPIDEGPLSALIQRTNNLRAEVVRLAFAAYERAEADGFVRRPVLTIVDYELPSYEKRLWVFDMERGELMFEEWVAHGMGKPAGAGGDLEAAKRFSNEMGTRMSSLGLFVTAETYHGRHGYTLRLDGLEPGINDAARERLIVFHGAHYVSEEQADNGRMGRSWGCPVVRPEISKQIIDAIKDGSIMWVYYPDEEWLAQSIFLGTE